ncbi:hypothetical protein BZARG_3069 [Bizionia argentinensis JUB59]|uniref:Uncharacterized protein n=1 Tax=Bizionia argentinensis JUB59 TaxID=1046627 RepID=G2EEP6_9FLAO|nr:hypothetical protein [Bizionia argentinensis]EGV43084.1 hypothetical protein BZARG_3069 [Bizionia argentinensis JUB59]
MKETERNIKKENFIEWTTFIEDRVNNWTLNAPKKLVDVLDYSPESLKVIEKYILENYTRETLGKPENKSTIDAIISYYSEVFMRNLPNSIWHIELEDENSVDFNLPCIKTPIGTLVNPYYLIKRVMAKNKGTFLYDFYVKRLGYINNPETY